MSTATASRAEEVVDRLLAEREPSPETGTDLVPAERPITNGEIDMIWRLGNGLAKSGMFKDAKQADQAFAKLIFGRDLGLSATQAMTDIHIVEGKPEMSANLQAGKVKASTRYEYDVLKLDDEGCEIAFSEGDRLLGVSTFTKKDADQAALGGKTTYTRFPRNMFFARAMSNGVAWYCPDVMNGIRVYAEGEVQRAIATVAEQPPAADAEVPDAEVIEDAPVGTEALAALRQAFDVAGIDEQTELMLLGSVGVEALDELTPVTLAELQQAIAAHTTGGAS